VRGLVAKVFSGAQRLEINISAQPGRGEGRASVLAVLK
jgi:hypothetical protein